MSKYYKGNTKGGGQPAVFCVYNEPQKALFPDEDYTVEASYMGDTSVMRFQSIEECKGLFHIGREIGEAEYSLYKDPSVLMTEFRLSGSTGGFPREETVKDLAREIRRDVQKALLEIEEGVL